MIYVAFTEDWGFTGKTISILHFDSWKDFTKWINGCDPKELYVSESIDEIFVFISQLLYSESNNSTMEER